MGRSGFTLIELVVALAVASLVLLAASRIQSGVLDAAQASQEAGAQLTADGNARRLLVALAGGIEVSPAHDGFDGGEHRANFTAWVAARQVWPERLRVTLREQDGRVIVDGLGGAPIVVADSVQRFDLDYLPAFGADSRWMRVWSSSLTAPVVIRVRLGRAAGADTLLLHVGARG